MRDPRKFLAVTKRRRRRAAFVALMLAATPAVAGDPSSPRMTMPPLPLHASHNAAVKMNPFCVMPQAAPSSPVQLASGGESAVRLLPIGAAIGLQPIGDGQAERIERPAMTIEKPAESEIQSNPLIGSAHHDNQALVDAAVENVAAGTSLLLKPVQRTAPTPPPKPVFFSFSDDADDASDAADMDSSDVGSSDVGSSDVGTSDVETNDAAKADESVAEAVTSDEASIAVSRGDTENEIDHGFVQPVVIDDNESSLTAIEFTPEQDEQLIELERRKSVIEVTPPTPEPTLYDKRYRPPVAVTSVPVMFGRDELNRSIQVQTAVDAVSKTESKNAAAAAAAATTLHLGRAQVRSLTIGGEVRGVRVVDQSVCQAFSAGPNQLKLIGTGTGITRLVVWATPEKSGSKAVMRAFDVHVGEAIDAVGDDAPDRTEMLNASIRQAFPNADAVVHHRQNELIVTGRCGSEDVARKIVRMVRKTCLVPVRDELVVR